MERELSRSGVCDEEGARFSAQATRNKSTCCVLGCRSRAWKDFTVRFHCFPKPGIDFVTDIDEFGSSVKTCRRDAWKRRLMMEKTKLTEHMRVCSLHFRKSDYISPDAQALRRYLRRDAVPSCNLPRSKKNISPLTMATCRMNDLAERSESRVPDNFIEIKRESRDTDTEDPDLEAGVEHDHSYTIPRFMDAGTGNDVPAIKIEFVEPEIKLEPAETNEREIREDDFSDERMTLDGSTIKDEYVEPEIKFESVDLPDFDLNDDFQRSDETSTIATLSEQSRERGSLIYSEKSIQTDDEFVETRFIDTMRTDRALSIMSGIPSHVILRKLIVMVEKSLPRFTKAPGLRITLAERIIMTFMKLKQGLNYGILAIFFKCSTKDICKRIVLRTIDILYDCLKLSICRPVWENDTTFVACEFENFSNIRWAISRIEIAVRRPKDTSRRRATRSIYRRYHSVKFVTAVDPYGSICFVSRPFDGRNSHRDAFARSNIVELFRKNDAIIILKDFQIDDICHENGVKLVRSLYTRNKNNPDISQAYRSRLNVNRRIRKYRIFHRKLTFSLHARAEKIVTIICAIENLRKNHAEQNGVGGNELLSNDETPSVITGKMNLEP